MLRHVELNNELCLQDENHELFLKHDLKGNQFDTLAYLFYKEQNQGLLGKDAAELSGPALHFYRECEKEAVESFRQCCKHGNVRVLWEFYLYERLCCNSTNRIIVDQVIASQLLQTVDKKAGGGEAAMANAEWLLDSNYSKLFKKNCKLAFNTDLVQIQFQAYFTQSVFNFDLVGPAKDLHMLKARCLADRCLAKLSLGKAAELEEGTLETLRAEIDQIKLDNVRSFADYFVYRRVNNPTLAADLGQKAVYGRDALEGHFEVMKIGLDVVHEFLAACLPFAGVKLSSSKIEESALGGVALEKAKAELSSRIKTVMLKESAAFASADFFAVSHLLRTLLGVSVAYSRIGQEVKANSKQLLKSKSEAEKEQVSKCLSGYAGLKDYVKDAAKAVEETLQTVLAGRQFELKEQVWDGAGVAWPAVLKAHHGRLAASYSSMLSNAVLELQTRLAMLRKTLN
jgi:hypothetical protein